MFDSKGKMVPCVGVSIGVKRVFALTKSTAQKHLVEHRLHLCQELWEANIKTEPKAPDQFQYCETNGIPIAVILGQSEIESNSVTTRIIATREERKLPRDVLKHEIRKVLVSLS